MDLVMVLDERPTDPLESPTEFLRYLAYELWSMVKYNVSCDAIESDNIAVQEVIVVTVL